MHAARYYQQALIDDVMSFWARGGRNCLGVLPTGGGKTFVFSRIASLVGMAVCAIAHRGELVTQISAALAREGVRHRIVGPAALARQCTAAHLDELKRDFVEPNARIVVAGVDTLIKTSPSEAWLQQIGLWIQDEAHHVLQDNKWGKAAKLFPNARGLGVTATPIRADGKGLGKHADGLFEEMFVGPTMRELIDQGYLTDYKIYAPPNDLDLSSVAISAGGDFNHDQVAAARKKSRITGDVVQHYLRLARGKRGVTFDTDVESATKTAQAFRDAGVPAEVVHGGTPAAIRADVLRRFARGEILQLVNVDLFGEGFDLPAIEVVSFARPTMSFALFCLDPETEVLTPSGWLRAGEALRSTEVIAYDLQTGKTQAAPVTGSVCRPLMPEEFMVALESPHLSVCVSDQHDLIVRSTSATSKAWQKQTAAHVSARSGLMRVPVAGRGDFAGSGLTRSELHFLGWFLSDGNLNKKTNGITISQSSRKPAHIESIRGSVEGCGFKYGFGVYRRKGVPSTHADPVRFTVSYGAPRGRDKHLAGWSRLEKWVDKSIPACYDSLTREELLTLLETWNLGDGANETRSMGHTPRTLRISCGDNSRMADRLQALCVQRGLRANIHRWNEPGRSEWHNVHIKDVEYSTIAGRGVANGSVGGKKPYERSRLERTEHRPPFAWCLTNPLGTLITRRQGRVVVVGNCQQFGRALRILDGKAWAIIIDHVGNTLRHGLPDAARVWSLDRRERRGSSRPNDVIPTRVCLNVACNGVYERVHASCPYCGHTPVPAGRSSPELVDGDLTELDAETLRRMRGEVQKLDGMPFYPANASAEIRGAIAKNHFIRQRSRAVLREAIATWAGWQRSLGRDDQESYRRFFFHFGVDVLGAQALRSADAEALAARIQAQLDKHQVVSHG